MGLALIILLIILVIVYNNNKKDNYRPPQNSGNNFTPQHTNTPNQNNFTPQNTNGDIYQTSTEAGENYYASDNPTPQNVYPENSQSPQPQDSENSYSYDQSYGQSYGRSEPTTVDKLFAWVKEDFLVKLGSFFLILAFIWLLSYAVENDWIGSWGIVVISILSGVAVMYLGVNRFAKGFKNLGAIFTGLGTSIVSLACIMATTSTLEHIFNPLLALVFVVLTVAYASFVSVQFESKSLAIFNLLWLWAAPLYVTDGQGAMMVEKSADFLIPYFMIVSLGQVYIIWFKNWKVLTPLAIFVSFSFVMTVARSGNFDDWLLVASASLFAAIYLSANTLTLIRQHADDNNFWSDGFSFFGLAILLFVPISSLVKTDEMQSLLFVLWALIFGLAAYVTYSSTSNRRTPYFSLAMAIIMLASAALVLFEGPILMSILFIITLVLSFAVFSVSGRVANLAVSGAFLLFLDFFTLGFLDGWGESIFHTRALNVLLAAVSSLTIGSLIYLHKDKQNYRTNMDTTLFFVGGFYGMALVWKVCGVWFMHTQAAYYLPIIIYALVGVAMYVFGRSNDSKLLRVVGMTLILLSSAYFLFIGVSLFGEAGKIIAAFVIGLALVATAFLGRAKK